MLYYGCAASWKGAKEYFLGEPHGRTRWNFGLTSPRQGQGLGVMPITIDRLVPRFGSKGITLKRSLAQWAVNRSQRQNAMQNLAY